jgi:uncharacterized membrane protein YfcA
MTVPLVLAAIIAILSVVQSLFGVGLLVFGTPTLLLMGFSLPEALAWLLPASVTISTLQLLKARDQARRIWAGLAPLFCLAPLVVSLVLVLVLHLRASVELVVGGCLLAAAAVRCSKRMRDRAGGLVLRAERFYLAVMGAVHGATNMGGAMLVIYASAKSSEKKEIRGIIATYYLSFGAAQLIVLAAVRPGTFDAFSILSGVIAGVVYLSFGTMVFNRASERAYASAVTGLMAAYGIALVVRSAL